jgi:flagellar biogenesis protein FliO
MYPLRRSLRAGSLYFRLVPLAFSLFAAALTPAALGQETAPIFDGGSVSPKAFQPPHQELARVPGAQKISGANGESRDRVLVPAHRTQPIPPAVAAASHQQAAAPTQAQEIIPASTSAAKTPKLLSHGEKPKPLAPAAAAATDSGTSLNRGLDSLMTVLGSMGIVLGLFVVTAWCLRRSVPKSGRPLPAEVVEVLGRAPLAGKLQMHLIRFGSKLVLVAASPDGVKAICEITESQEVDRIAGYCQEKAPYSATSAFRGILDRLDKRGWQEDEEPVEPPNRGFASLVGRKGRRAEDEYV